ncbi:hypothetical protein BE04_45575 [Sorangium cellulosum]|uniref:Protein kinase domain-containing protein n=1 Tax=Sorangium cellulosum TaxID=56 RepID=A0A150PBD8_SORCE|nr:hypothetical protein BE04_45575 [Sorangium cellulosum]
MVRVADHELKAATLEGSICTVLSPRQLGKSSLVNRLRQSLPSDARMAYIDLQQGIEHDPAPFYLAICSEIAASLHTGLRIEDLSPPGDGRAPERVLHHYLSTTVVEALGTSRLIICFDEIDRLLVRDFRDDFFAGIRAFFNAGANRPELRRIGFVLVGAVTPDELASNPQLSPFNIAREIRVGDLPREDAQKKLAVGLPFPKDLQNRAFDRVWFWTSGHPYLTQRTCSAIAEQDWGRGTDVDLYVDTVVKRLYLDDNANDTNTIPFIKKLVRSLDPPRCKSIISVYREIYQGRDYKRNQGDPSLLWLLMTGLVHPGVEGRLEVRNRIFRTVFGEAWIEQQLAGYQQIAPPGAAHPSSGVVSQKLEAAIERRQALRRLGNTTEEVDSEILSFKRQLREGGQLRAGDALGEERYLLLEQIGRGGFATVWRAHDRDAGTMVAVKLLHPNLAGDQLRRERFVRGARVMAALQHPAIVRVVDAGAEDAGFYYFVMEYVAGGDLRRAVLANALTTRQIISIILEVGDALALAHSKGIIHRDVKPANILLDARRRPLLADFDLVAAADTTGGTRTGALGTFIYSAPESMHRPQDADARADVYGLGMTAVFCLHGAELPMTVLRDADSFIEQLPCEKSIRSVLRRSVDWDREFRFSTVQALCDALRVATMEAEAELLQWGAADDPDATTKIIRSTLVHPGVEMIDLPAGSFWMGSYEGQLHAHADELPPRRVTVSAFSIAKYAVTQELYHDIMCTNPSDPIGRDLPVNLVSWFDAVVFCNQLSKAAGLRPAYVIEGEYVVWDREADGYRLPTEAEWEYAARGPDGLIYPWGNEPPSNQLCWDGEGNDMGRGRRSGPSAVGSYPAGASPFGVMNMVGNVWEWCWDWYGAYRDDAEVNSDPIGPSIGKERVIRGGSWLYDDPSMVRGAYRDKSAPDNQDIGIGFRCVRSARR